MSMQLPCIYQLPITALARARTLAFHMVQSLDGASAKRGKEGMIMAGIQF